MRSIRFVIVGLFSLVMTLPGMARAQLCANATPVSCGDSFVADTGDGSNTMENYSCESWTFIGRDLVYALTLTADMRVTVELDPDSGLFTSWDGGLMVLPEIFGDCYPSAASHCVDHSGSGGVEDVTATFRAGTHYLVVDGYKSGDYGDFRLTIECDPCIGCTDSDGDGHDQYTSGGCPCGTDCNDNNPDINPETAEICADGIDQDCDGSDPACPNCSANAVLLCGDAGSANTSNGSSNLDRYCDTRDSYWDTREYIFALTHSADTTFEVVISNFGSQQLDAFAFTDFGVYGTCNKDACLDRSTNDSGAERLVYFAAANETSFVSVDGRNSDQGTFNYSVACLSESCQATEQLACDDVISGNNTGGDANVSAYRGLSRHLLGPEVVYAYTNVTDARVTLILNIDEPGGVAPDLDLVVIADDGGGACLPANVVAFSAFEQTPNSNPPEFLDFHALGGLTHYIVVDGREAGDVGGFQLRADCEIECSQGTVECSGLCVDLTSDPQHCGACSSPCTYQHASALCIDSVCALGECDPNWGDCNLDELDGCEADLNTGQNCGVCDQGCNFDHASGQCVDGNCVMGACDQNWDNCNGLTQDGCEAYLLSSQNCGACGNTCTAEQVCHEGNCLAECPGDLSNCEGACVDISSDLQHCGACNTPCIVPNGRPLCANGLCLIESCNQGFEDCNADSQDGCEIQLGTIQNCSVCGDACEYLNASGTCTTGGDTHTCVMGLCDDGFDNCNDLTSDGCEADVAWDHDNCGFCGRVCGAQEMCAAGECTIDCDADGDDFDSSECGGVDCDDLDPDIHPGADDVCDDGIDQDCDGRDEPCNCFDKDGDGYIDGTCGGDDCDDDNGYVYPGAPEICGDGIDQDCNELDLPCTCPDSDGDGHEAEACGGDDCDDGNHAAYPGADEVCEDGIDQDCDGFDVACPGGCGCSQPGRFGSLALLITLMGMLIAHRPRPA